MKGIGNGLTAPHDLECEADAKALVWLLSESVAQRLRESRLRCRTVSVGVRRAGDLSGYSRQRTFESPTCLTKDIADAAFKLILENQPIDEEHALRAIHVRTTNLTSMDVPVQHDLLRRCKSDICDGAIGTHHRRPPQALRQPLHQARSELTDETMAGLDIKRDNTVHPIGFSR